MRDPYAERACATLKGHRRGVPRSLLSKHRALRHVAIGRFYSATANCTLRKFAVLVPSSPSVRLVQQRISSESSESGRLQSHIRDRSIIRRSLKGHSLISSSREIAGRARCLSGRASDDRESASETRRWSRSPVERRSRTARNASTIQL